MEQLIAIAFFIALFGGIYDLYTKRIPNWWTLPCIVFGLGVQTYFYGMGGFGHALLAIFCATALYLPLYLFDVMGAGDVKLLMAIGAWSDYNFIIHVAILSIFVGGVYAFIDTFLVGRLPTFIKNIFYSLRSIFIQGLPFFKPDLDTKRKFSFGLSMAISTALVIGMKNTGWNLL